MIDKKILEAANHCMEHGIYGECEDCCAFGEWDGTCTERFAKAVIELAEKQIPKKPVNPRSKALHTKRCPECGCEVEHYAYDESCYSEYCEHCGQAIDWSENND